MAVTQLDIAKRVGVNRSLVSVVLNNKPTPIKVSLATRKRIFQAIGEMNYKPNLLARGLAQGKTNTIGFLVDGTFGIRSAQAMVLDGIAGKAGYRMLAAHTRSGFDWEVETAEELVARGVDGLIIRGGCPDRSAEELRSKLNFSVPTVFVEAQMPFACRRVYTDGAVGFRQAVDHLCELGHREIHLFRTDWLNWEKDLRFVGFAEAVQVHGLGDPQERIYKVADHGRVNEEGYRVRDPEEIFSNTETFIKAHPECTAIMCNDDEIALIVLSALQHMGIRVPEDISLIGYENIPATMYSRPALTTIAQPISKLMQAAYDLLVDGIQNDNNEPKEVGVPARLIIRRSTGPARETKLKILTIRGR